MKDKTPFEKNVQRQLNDCLNKLDSTTISKLENARRKALHQEIKTKSIIPVWITGIVTGVVMAMLIIFIMPTFQQSGTHSLSIEKWDEMALSGEELELYDDLDFYLWLDENKGG